MWASCGVTSDLFMLSYDLFPPPMDVSVPLDVSRSMVLAL